MNRGSDRHKNQKKILIGILVVAATFAIIFGGMTVYEQLNNKQLPGTPIGSVRWIDDNTVYIDSELYGFDHRMETYLFIGTDASGNEAGEGREYQGGMADYLMLFVMDHTTDTYGCIAIDRNTITEVRLLDENGKMLSEEEVQICTAHWYGRDGQESAENTVLAVRTLLGELESIDGYFVMNMENIGLLNNVVGGVPVTIEDEMENVDPAFVKGTTLTLTDEQAEKYVRARMQVGEGDNASRMRRQQTYMESFFGQLEKCMKEKPEYAQKFWNTLRDSAVTDMTGNDISRIGEKIRSGKSKGILHIEGETVIGTTLADGLEHEEFYPEESSIYQVMNELFTLVHIEDEEESEDDEDFYEEYESDEDEYETDEYDTEDYESV